MKMKKEDREIFLKQIFWEVVGSAFIAGGIYNFAVQAGFPMTGFSGISIILYQLFGVPIGFSTILLNIPVAILCYRLLGRHFFFSSLRCMLISSLMIDYVAPLLPVYSGDRLLAALCTGVFAGLGYAVIYMQNSSTGGSDFIIMAVKNLKPYWSVGKISFVTDHSSGRISASGCGWNYLRNDCEFSAGNRGRQADVRHQFRENDTCRDRVWKGDLRCDRFLLRPRLYDITGTGRLPL